MGSSPRLKNFQEGGNKMGVGGEIKQSTSRLLTSCHYPTRHAFYLKESEESIFGKNALTVIYSLEPTDMCGKLLAAAERTNGHGLNAAILKLLGFADPFIL